MKLIILILILIISIINISIIPRQNINKIKKTSLFYSIILLIYYSFIFINFKLKNQFQISWTINWISKSDNLNWSNITFSMDGISFIFIGLSILLIPICILISWNSINYFIKEFNLSLLIILIALVGVFISMDIIIFYILFESILIPMFLIIGVWGSRDEKVKAAFYFFFYTLIGSLLMLISIFKLYTLTGTSNYLNLVSIELPSETQWWLFLGFFASLSVKIPMIPVHIWLPQAHVEAPVAGSVILAGILLKLGGYGFIRFGYPIFPIASYHFSPLIILMSLIAIIYASFSTFRQTDIKRLIAYSSVSHMGLVTLSIFAHSIEGVTASIVTMIAHGLISSSLFMSSSILYSRHHTRIIKYYRGITTTMPIFSIISLILILANMGFPLTLNFIAEFFSILTAFSYSYIIGVLICIGALVSTCYSLYYYNRVYFGISSLFLVKSRDLTEFEFQSFFPLVLITVILGIWPNNLLNLINTSCYLNISL